MNNASEQKRKLILRIFRWCVHSVLVVIAILATLILVTAFASRSKLDLESWHRDPIDGEFVAADLTAGYTLAQYLVVEETLFANLSEHMLDPDNLQGHSMLSRFTRGGSQDPARQPINWNRTVELVPEAPKGGVLLLHGLSDSPYSMRGLAEHFFDMGYYVLVMRMPGHGTVPAGLLEATWKDWAAAVKVGTRHVQSQIDVSLPFYIGGYSNGGALAVEYCLGAIRSAERVPDQLFLFSPAIGIMSLARVARLDALYGFIPYFEKSKWVGIEPEYDPYKYNSFPKNAGTQSWRLANAIQLQLDALERSGQLAEIPPILTLQSVVDDTVKAEVLVTGLYDRLEPNGSEVVFFDINRTSMLDGFISLDFSQRLNQLMQLSDRNYTVTRLTNRDAHSLAMNEHTRSPGGSEFTDLPLELEWPAGVYSLAHVAVPFSPDDPLYGATPPNPPVFDFHIGSMAPKGERSVLTIPASQIIRIRHNPFYEYMIRRVTEAIESQGDNTDGSADD